MFRVPLVALAALAAALLAASSPAAVPKLTGNVGPGFTITLSQGGKKVTSLKPGKYSLSVNDKGSSHNFRLSGPGFNKATSVPRTGKTTFAVTLRRGTYRFVCDPHSSSMKGSFQVR
jgi:Copper binding proteins, plastocyanin/azurin family